MRSPLPASVVLAAFLTAGATAPVPVAAQGAQPPQQQQPAPPKPYKPVAIRLPQPVKDPSFEAFRKQLGAIAQKKDRAGLAKLVSPQFYWMVEDKDNAVKGKPGIDNLARAIGLDGRDATGWELLASYATDPTGEPDPQHKGSICAPADPSFDEKAADELAQATNTDVSEWGYPTADGVEVHATQQPTSPVTEKLGLHLVRVYPDDSPANAVQADMLRIVTPAGKMGYVAIDSLLPLANDQLCYVKNGNTWLISGFLGGGAGTTP